MYRIHNIVMMISIVGMTCVTTIYSQGFNQWQGSGEQADWNDPYKWKLQHVPSSEETVVFRQDQSVVTVSSTVELENGMMLYGQDLFLRGHGNINLRHPVPHRQSVNIPASASGYANLTLSDTLSLKGRIALAAKAFGTSLSKGSLTLNDRSNVMGILSIGSNGAGRGQVFINDQATFRISGLELNTLSEKGGIAEIHLLGGTASLDADVNAFEIFMQDSSRRIIIGNQGKLIIDSQLPEQQKNTAIAEMIDQQRLVAAPGCYLTPPAIHDNMIILGAAYGEQPEPSPGIANDQPTPSELSPQLATSDDTLPEKTKPSISSRKYASSTNAKSSKLESLLQDMQTNQRQEVASASTHVNPELTDQTAEEEEDGSPLTGYIVFISAILFMIRPKISE